MKNAYERPTLQSFGKFRDVTLAGFGNWWSGWHKHDYECGHNGGGRS